MTDLLDLSAFSGWVRLADLPASAPTDPGVYVVTRTANDRPVFREAVPYRGDVAFPLAELDARWVPGASVVYIGKANHGGKCDGLYRRLRQLGRYGAGRAARHSGGRAIWQLADYADLLVGWRVTDDDQARPTEAAMIAEFRARNGGKRPFGNGDD